MTTDVMFRTVAGGARVAVQQGQMTVTRVTIDMDAAVPPTTVADWRAVLGAMAVGVADCTDRMNGLWAVRVEPSAEDWQKVWIVVDWVAGSVMSPPPLPKGTIAIIHSANTVGTSVTGITAEDLPESPYAARATLEHMARAHGTDMEPVLALWMCPVDDQWARLHPFRSPRVLRDRRLRNFKCGPLEGEWLICACVSPNGPLRSLDHFDGPVQVFTTVMDALRRVAINA